jgi:endonuclease/exonuclease/phosphatase family metal-dependent hydrolase
MLPRRSMKRFYFALIVCVAWLFAANAMPAQEVVRRQVTVCSYNLKNYLKMERFVKGVRMEGVSKPESEKQAVVHSIVAIKPDILGICEIGSAEEVQDLQQRLKQAGLDLPNVEMAGGGDPTRRLALLTHLPIVARNSQAKLSYQIGQKIFPVSRGFLDATVQLRPGWELRCVGIHLKSKREVPEADQGLMRRNEAHLLRNHLEGILKDAPQTKVLCYGDFNEHAHEAPIVEIEGVPGMELSMRDVRLRDRHGLTWTHYWEFADVYSRFDYFFVSRELQSHVNHKESYIYDAEKFDEASDHRPIVVKIDLAK